MKIDAVNLNEDVHVQPPPSKRLKLEEDPDGAQRLLTQTKRRRGGQKPRSTIEERALVLLNDDRISAVEPSQVLCRMCGHWIQLFKHTDYSPANWRTHADKCEPRSGWKDRIDADPGAAFALTIPALTSEATASETEMVLDTALVSSDTLKSLDQSIPEEDSSLLHSNMRSPTRRTSKSASVRFKELEDDPRCENPGPHSVFCRMCEQSVRLHNTREFDLWNWLRHAEKCEVKNGWAKADSAVPQLTKSGAETVVDFAMESPHRDQIGSLRPDISVGLLGAGTTAESSRGKLMPVSDDRQKGPTIRLPPRPVESLEVPRSSNEAQEEEVRTEDRLLTTEGALHYATLAKNNAQLSASVSNTLFIKAEPNDSDTHLLSIREPDPSHEMPSASISAGAKKRKGRTAEERRQALLDDARITQVQPNEVLCKMCNKWIKLYKEVEYVESNWVRHAERCGLRAAARIAAKAALPTPPASVSSATAVSPNKRSLIKCTEDRLRDLQADSRIETIEPHRVLCGLCKQWIKLQLYRDYDIWNWRKHIPLCEQRHTGGKSDSLRPLSKRQDLSSRSETGCSFRPIKLEDNKDVLSAPAFAGQLPDPPKILLPVKVKDETAPEERRAILERDDRCENVEPQRVTCKICNRTVGLHVKKDYSLSNWYKHVASCVKQSGKQPVKSAHNFPAIPVDEPSSSQTINDGSNVIASVTRTNTNDGSNVVAGNPTRYLMRNREINAQHTVSAPVVSNKVSNKSTPEERRAKLSADPRAEVVEPNRIKCKLCQHWLKLNEFMDYAPYNWYKHIERCEIRESLKDKGTFDAPILVKEEPTDRLDAKAMEEPSLSSDNAARKRTTPAERLARMQSDPRIKTIEKHRARCGLCGKWVKLQNKTEYDPHNWFAHIKKCAMKSSTRLPEHSSAPLTTMKQESSPIINFDSDSASAVNERDNSSLTLSRRTLLLNDVRSAAVEPHRVLCGICQQWIKLRDGKDYVPYNWFKHKRKCERRHGFLMTATLRNENTPTIPLVIVKQEQDSADLALLNSDKSRMTDEERAAQLRADPRLGDVDPGRVFCKMCDSWIKLNMSTGFLHGNWLRHAQRCKGRASWKGATPETTAEPPELSSIEVIDLETNGVPFGSIELGRLIGKFEPTISSIDYGKRQEAKPTREVVKQPSTWNMPTLRARPNNSRVNSPAPLSQGDSRVTDSGKRMHRTEEARKQELESDPRTKVVLPDKILCGMCDRWIQMRRDVAYSSQNWLKHAGICESKTGGLKKPELDGQNVAGSTEPSPQVPEDELIPYNARVRVEEQIDIEPPSLKPVDWGQVVYSDDDNDSDEMAVDDPSSVVQEKGTYMSFRATSELTQGQSLALSKIAADSVKNLKTPVSTPLTGGRNNADLKAMSGSLANSTGLKTSSTSPPLIGPFTTVPLTYYHAAYASHMIQHRFASTREGAPPKSRSPHNAGSQRAMSFVVPASSMLPHLLPRPVLVPISHTSRQTSGTISPFHYPSSPSPSVPAAVPSGEKGNSPAPSVRATANIRPAKNSVNGIQATHDRETSTTPFRTAEHDGLAVPTPVRTSVAHDSIKLSGRLKSGSRPPISSSNAPENPGNGQPAVLQLAPEITKVQEKPKLVELTGTRVVSGVLQLGPTVNSSSDRVGATLEYGKVGSNSADSRVSSAGITVPDQKESPKSVLEVLQLGLRSDLPLDKEAENPRAEKTSPSALPGSGVLQLAPTSEVLRDKESRAQISDGTAGPLANANSEIIHESDTTMLESNA